MKRSRAAEIVGLVLFLALCIGIAALGSAVTAASLKSWYAGLAKPSFHPPDTVFGPVWTVLYVLLAIAAWRVWRIADRDTARGPLTMFALQLALNLGWSVAFFGLQRAGAAVAVILVLEVAVVATALAFRPIDRIAALLLLPHILWVAFVMALNIAIWRLN
jgi:tryptophan-rich sensory protein